MTYKEFLNNKKQDTGYYGFEPLLLPDYLFDFQKSLVEWALKKGRCALFEDCGLGKTIQFLVWADNIVKKTNKNVLILTPLAVATQTIKEGEKFGIEVTRSKDGKPAGKITVTNYERLHLFDKNDFIGVVCDESSAIKNFEGARRKLVTYFLNKMPYRLLDTATAAPNDFIELGTSSEALGELTQNEMLQQFFRNTENDKNPQWSDPKWILKKHGSDNFWRWVSSWARAIRKPSDIGFEDKQFILPELKVSEIIITNSVPLPGEMFVRKAKTLEAQRLERKMTLNGRCEKVAELVENEKYSVVWCQYNYESDYLAKIIPNSVNIQGSNTDEYKEDKLSAFSNGEIKVLITKPKIGAFGLNWQHCSHMTYFPSHSYEQYYQGVRRCWRFGQQNPVKVDIITTEGEIGVYNNLERKQKQAEGMFAKLVKFMNNPMLFKRQEHNQQTIRIPTWLHKTA